MQNAGLCFAGLFVRGRERGDFFFVKARWHRGTLVVSQRTFWLPKSGEFDLTHRNAGIKRAVYMPRLPEPIESERYHQRMEVSRG